MATTSSEIKAELLLRLPGSEKLMQVGTVAIPLKIERHPTADDYVTVTADVSGFERMAAAYNEEH